MLCFGSSISGGKETDKERKLSDIWNFFGFARWDYEREMLPST